MSIVLTTTSKDIPLPIFKCKLGLKLYEYSRRDVYFARGVSHMISRTNVLAQIDFGPLMSAPVFHMQDTEQHGLSDYGLSHNTAQPTTDA